MLRVGFSSDCVQAVLRGLFAVDELLGLFDVCGGDQIGHVRGEIAAGQAGRAEQEIKANQRGIAIPQSGQRSRLTRRLVPHR
jgi:hypothetical protein